jgi:hypothetical protein
MHQMSHSTIAAALMFQHATDRRARELAARLNQVVESEMAEPE